MPFWGQISNKNNGMFFLVEALGGMRSPLLVTWGSYGNVKVSKTLSLCGTELMWCKCGVPTGYILHITNQYFWFDNLGKNFKKACFLIKKIHQNTRFWKDNPRFTDNIGDIGDFIQKNPAWYSRTEGPCLWRTHPPKKWVM